MQRLIYPWRAGRSEHALTMVGVEGTNGSPYSFGDPRNTRQIEVAGFYISTVPVTQALWSHVMGADNQPSIRRGDGLPVENVSWDDITQPGGFLDRINSSNVWTQINGQLSGAVGTFRLPSESEW
jgi:formylglycine-generating enzyme required for sulfatase activity